MAIGAILIACHTSPVTGANECPEIGEGRGWGREKQRADGGDADVGQTLAAGHVRCEV
jgi:hypothetical protein